MLLGISPDSVFSFFWGVPQCVFFGGSLKIFFLFRGVPSKKRRLDPHFWMNLVSEASGGTSAESLSSHRRGDALGDLPHAPLHALHLARRKRGGGGDLKRAEVATPGFPKGRPKEEPLWT